MEHLYLAQIRAGPSRPMRNGAHQPPWLLPQVNPNEQLLYFEGTPNTGTLCSNAQLFPQDFEYFLRNGYSDRIEKILGGSQATKAHSYLDQLAAVCLSAGIKVCNNEGCMRYRMYIEGMMPECNWVGLRKWAIQIATCLASLHDRHTKCGGSLKCLEMSVDACINLTQLNSVNTNFDIEGGTRRFPGHLIDHTFPRKDLQAIRISDALEILGYLRGITRTKISNEAPYFRDSRFTKEVILPQINEASKKVQKLGLCQNRVWNLVRDSPGKEMELPALVLFLEKYPSLRHEGHEACTADFCEFVILNNTRVEQHHKCKKHGVCEPVPKEMFSQSVLEVAAKDNAATAWSLDGLSTVLPGKPYLAISHVWSDGTGAGKWPKTGLNGCLWEFWAQKARELNCEGVWWDTVSIPVGGGDLRSSEMDRMHTYYSTAKCTLVHDMYLLDIEWADDGSPCVALALSPFFTRGWTAIEIFLSREVKVLFKSQGGKGLVMKDLDTEILGNHTRISCRGYRTAASLIRTLRSPLRSVDDLLVVLKPRYTAWAIDRSLIAGHIVGLTDHSHFGAQETYKHVLTKLGRISRSSLFHGHPTLGGIYSWCPANILELPTGHCPPEEMLRIHRDGSLSGHWHFRYIMEEDIRESRLTPYSCNPLVRLKIQSAFQNWQACILLMNKSDPGLGVLVDVLSPFQLHPDKPQQNSIHCRYIGCVNVSNWDLEGLGFLRMTIGREDGMTRVTNAAEHIRRPRERSLGSSATLQKLLKDMTANMMTSKGMHIEILVRERNLAYNLSKLLFRHRTLEHEQLIKKHMG